MLSLGVTTVECKSGYGLDYDNEIKQLEVYQHLDQTHPVDLVATFLGAHIVPPEYRDRREEYIRLLCNELIPSVAGRDLARFCDVFVEGGAYTIDEARDILSAASAHGLQLKIHADQLSDGGGALLAAQLGRYPPNTWSMSATKEFKPWLPAVLSPSAFHWPLYTWLNLTCLPGNCWPPVCQ